jgi:hypothetical protein
MNLFNFYTQRKQLMDIQMENDSKMAGLPCKEVLAMFLLYERGRTREQIEGLKGVNVWSLTSYMNAMHDLNKQNLLYLKDHLAAGTACSVLPLILASQRGLYAVQG